MFSINSIVRLSLRPPKNLSSTAAKRLCGATISNRVMDERSLWLSIPPKTLWASDVSSPRIASHTSLNRAERIEFSRYDIASSLPDKP